MNIQELKKARYSRRKQSVRKNVFGSPELPRMTVKRSLNNIYVQIIDDINAKTLVAASSLDKDVKDAITPEMKKTDLSKLVGKTIAGKAKEANINKIVFDRNGYLYHGRIKALADAAREAGLEF